MGKSESKKAKKKNTRDESSLKALTKRFVTLIGDASNGVLDLNEAAKLLSVQKRRIYDITNVLEGIELIEKKGKNNIKWRGSGIAVTSSNSEESQEISQIKGELETLQRQNDQLDMEIAQAQRKTNLPEDKGPAFVCYDDIINIPTLQDRTIIAVRAPPGTMLTVPDPDDGLQYPDRRYQIFLKSKEEPIQVFLLKEGQQQQQQNQHQNQQHIAQQHQSGILSPAASRQRSISPYPTTPPPQSAQPQFQSPPHLERHSVAPQNLLSPTQDFRAIRQLSPPRE
eukprot:CAMPEP_0117428698 /NCGR_PEP_ID=MMETSP0758-20121206/8339_1 /TAXON_ID=63605 /ORGANISM="Percolomonas cosmopolitus, Strain AE-1 (ATCC 50343)" /LENGTH=281 /DNA_ID=CAMNT_0005215181 /DNA_START=277 /DNA_END=1119 /DNA_ORIENTATION=+